MTKKVIETKNSWYMENEKAKVELDDIIGLVECEPTNSVEEVRKLRGRDEEELDYYKTKCSSLEEGLFQNDREILKLTKENEQLKQDNNALIKMLENQSIIIQELHSKILEYELKEPIILTKEDLELMGKAVSYYTRGRYGE